MNWAVAIANAVLLWFVVTAILRLCNPEWLQSNTGRLLLDPERRFRDKSHRFIAKWAIIDIAVAGALLITFDLVLALT